LPYLRFSISVIRLFLVARLLAGSTLQAAAQVAGQAHMPYQRGQFWIRRLHKQAAGLCADLADWTAVPAAPNFVTRVLQMLQGIGWIAAHRFLFALTCCKERRRLLRIVPPPVVEFDSARAARLRTLRRSPVLQCSSDKGSAHRMRRISLIQPLWPWHG